MFEARVSLILGHGVDLPHSRVIQSTGINGQVQKKNTVIMFVIIMVMKTVKKQKKIHTSKES